MAVVCRRSMAAGRVYDTGQPLGPTHEELHVASAKLSGFISEVECTASEGMNALIDITVLVDPKRARDELGWVLRHTGVVAELMLCCESHKAGQVGT
jgi:hypothetical protein